MSVDKNIPKRLRKLMVKKSKKKPYDEMDVARKEIIKHKKALEILKKYDES